MNEEQQKVWESFNVPSHFLTPRLIAMCIAEGQLEFLMEPLSWGEWGILEDLYERYGIYSERYAPIFPQRRISSASRNSCSRAGNATSRPKRTYKE